MKREIKFRAWLEDENKMIHFDMIDLRQPEKEFTNEFAEYYVSEDPTMQYTGLKDKNGVEIFEGDILRDNIEMITDTVVWSEEGLGFDAVPNYPDTSFMQKMEVIGNIHENPELI